MNESNNIEQGEQRVTAADLHRITGFSKSHISKLKKSGKLIFIVDADNRERINLNDALEQFEGSRDYNRDAQRQWADTQRKGRQINIQSIDASAQLRELEGGRYFKGALRLAILKRDDYKCRLCGKTPKDGILLEIDHIIEFEDGGKTTFENGQTVCSDCNKGKHALKNMSENDEYVSQKEFARRVGVNRNVIADALDRGSIEKDIVTGNINYTTEVVKWFKNKYEYTPEPDVDNPHGLPEGNTTAFLFQLGNTKCADNRIGVETQRSKLVRETFEAHLSEMEYREKCGELINMQGVEEANRRIAGSIRSKFLGLPTKVAARCEGKTAAEIQYIIEDEVNSIFSELYQLGGGAEEK